MSQGISHVLAFFGAFNPPTAAHLELADLARRETGREGVLFVPSRTDYIRDVQGKDGAFSNDARLKMLETLARSRPWMLVTDAELRMEHQPRTYTTLCLLRREGFFPSLLMGSDKLPELATGWKNVEEIAREFGIVCMARGTDSCRRMIREDPFLSGLSDCIEVVETPDTWRDISSSAVRENLRRLRGAEQDPAALDHINAELDRMLPKEIRSDILSLATM